MATLKDVAKLANVDVSTVSRALNNSANVHPETKKRIFAAVKELSYSPNVISRGLKQGKRNTIGIIVPRLTLTVFSDIAQAIEEEARKLGYTTILCHTEDNPKIEKECLNRLRNGFTDGIIIAGTGRNNRLIRDIKASGIPVVQIIRKQDIMISSVVVDSKKCAYDAVNFLYDKGCREIGLINGDTKLMPYQMRYEGYHNALKKLELHETINNNPREENINSLEYGYNYTMELLEINPHLDALLAAVDAQAIGAMRALKERGYTSSDIKLISLMGQTLAGMLETSITAMEFPAFEIGHTAAAILVHDIESDEKDREKPQHFRFAENLIERESTW